MAPMKNNQTLRLLLSLAVLYGCVAGILLAVDALTAPVIRKHAEARKQSAVTKTLFGSIITGITAVEQLGEWTSHEKSCPYYKFTLSTGEIRYGMVSYGTGYGGLIKVAIALDTQFRVTGIDILEQTETAGLGDGVTTEDFKNQFTSRDSTHLFVSTDGDSAGVQALSGATISSRAVTEDAVKRAVVFLQQTIGKTE
jgi:electron transport complex protein RnfG